MPTNAPTPPRPDEAVARLKPDWRAHGVSEPLARLWLAHGGDHHGPRVEHITMPMANFTAFAEALCDRAGYEAASARPAVEGGWEEKVAEAIRTEIDRQGGRYTTPNLSHHGWVNDAKAALAAAPPPPVGDHKALIEALAPFADFGEFLAQETEGLHDLDQIELRFEESDVLLGRLSVGAFRLAAALSQRASGADEGWRDIASAPRDGTRVLVLTSSDQLPVEVMSYDGPSDGAIYSGARSVYNWANDAGVHAHDGALLGWIPLPPPPSGADEGAGG